MSRHRIGVIVNVLFNCLNCLCVVGNYEILFRMNSLGHRWRPLSAFDYIRSLLSRGNYFPLALSRANFSFPAQKARGLEERSWLPWQAAIADSYSAWSSCPRT